MLCNSQSAIALATRTEVQHKGSKHFNLKYDRVECNEIKVSYVRTEQNIADIFTKSLLREMHKGHAKSLGLGEQCISKMANYLFSHQPNGCGSPTVNDPSTYLSWGHSLYKPEKSQKSHNKLGKV